MMEQKYSAQFLRKRKLLLMLPILILPFITLAFWSLGGGTGQNMEADSMVENSLNATVPDANFKKEKPLDKLQAYALADRDSNRLEKMMKQDPYYRTYVDEAKDASIAMPVARRPRFHADTNPGAGKERQLLAQLEELQRALASEEPAQQEVAVPAAPPMDPTADKMLAMIDELKAEEGSEDPQLLQLNQMLDKIMAIQQRGAGGMEPTDRSEIIEQVHPMTAAQDAIEQQILTETGTRFWGLEDEMEAVEASAGIDAVIPETQTLVSGAIVKLRLLQDVHVGKVTLLTGEYVYGKATLNNERLQVEIPTVKTQTGIVPVKWRIYDMDGLEGIYVPGSIDRTVIQQSGGNGLQSVDLIGGIHPSLSMQAASLGIQTAKTLIGKKAKLVRLHVKAGYKVFIRDMASK